MAAASASFKKYIFCFLALCFVLGLLSLKDIFIHFESTLQAPAVITHNSMKGSWWSRAPAFCLQLPWSPKALRFLVIHFESQNFGNRSNEKFQCSAAICSQTKKTLCVYVWWRCRGWAVMASRMFYPTIPTDVFQMFFMAHTWTNFEESFECQLTDLDDGNVLCTLERWKGNTKSVWWRQAFFGRAGQKLANLVLLNLIPTATITELESLGSEVTSKWLHARVHTRLNDPKTHSYMIIAVNSSVWSLREKFSLLRPNFSPAIEPVWIHLGVVWNSSTLSSVQGMQPRHQPLPVRQREIKIK